MGDVVYRLTGDSGKAVKAFLRLTDAEKKAELGAKKAGRATKQWDQTSQDHGRSAVRDIGRMVAGLATMGTALATIRGEWQQHRQLVRESAEEMVRVQKAYVDLMFLGERLKDPTYRARITALSAKYDILPGEIYTSRYTMVGAMGKEMMALEEKGITPEQKKALIQERHEALLRLSLTGSATPTELAPTFAKMGGIYPGTTGVELSNIVKLAVEESALTSPTELAEHAPKALAAGLIGKLNPREVMAAVAVMSGVTGTMAQATGGMEMWMRKLMMEVTPLQKRAGIEEDENAIERLLKLGALHQRQPFSAQDIKGLVGERAMKYIIPMLEDPAALRGMVEKFERETAGDRDLALGKLKTAYATDEIYRLTRAHEGLEAMGTRFAQQPERLLEENYWKALKILWDKQGVGWTGRKAMSLDAALAAMWGEGAMVGQVGQQLRAAGEVPFQDVAGGERKAREILGLIAPEFIRAAENLTAASEDLRASAAKQLETTETIPPANAHTE